MCDPTVQSPIYQSFRSYFKDSLLASSLPISTQAVCYQDSSRRIELTTHGDRCAEGLDGHSSCSRRRFVCPCFTGPIGGLRHGRSWYSSASTGLLLSDRGISIQQWFQSYLSNRLQHVRVGSSSSSPGSMRCGVPQGSVLDAILFLLYCGDLHS